MLLFYIIGTRFYFFAIRIAALFSSKPALLIDGQKRWKEKLQSKIDPNSKYIWIHCASLGEFEQGRPLIEKFKSDPSTKEYKIILSFFSPSGYEVRKNYEQADIVCYLPFDKRKNAKEFISIVSPKFAVFVKYEFWHFYLKELTNQKIPSYIISAIFRKNQIFFKPYGGFFLKTLKSFKHIFVQDKNSGSLLKSEGISNVEICGDTRADRVLQIANEDYQNSILEDFSKDKNTIICGSTWPEDERLITEFINSSNDDFRFIIAPHEIDEKHLKSIEIQCKHRCIRYSNISDSVDSSTKLVIIDSIGLLSKLYRYGILAYIGGGFGKGIHNILEAAVYNIPVVFGPNHKKFKEAVDLIDLGSAFTINSQIELSNMILKTINNDDFAVNIRFMTNKHINQSSGSTQLIFNKMHYIGEF